jgi:hypothetical protein
MSESSSALEAVNALMRERQKYESWLETLEARRDSSPAHVFERVRTDYEQRLREVVEQLGAHSPVLEQQAHDLDSRMSSLGDDERQLRDRRAEAELRAMVGELSAADWETLARESDERLAALAADQERVRQELSQVRDLLTAATTPPRALTPVNPGPTTVADHGAMFPSASDTLVAPAAPAAPHAVADRSPTDGQAGAAPREMAAPPAREQPREQPQNGTSAFDELAFLQSVAMEPRPAAAAPSAGAPAIRPADPALGVIVQDGPAPDALAGARRSAGTPLAANVTGNQPIVLRTEGASPKTLKCTDCGSMNLPTEWYCERCGAELAAL